MVTIAYIVPNAALVIERVATQKGTNKEIKNVCPNEEKKLNMKPKFNKRLLLPINLNQSFTTPFL